MLCFLFFSFYLSSPESSCIHLFTIHTFVFSSIHCLQCFYHVCPPLTFSVLFLILLFFICTLFLWSFSQHTLWWSPFFHLCPAAFCSSFSPIISFPFSVLYICSLLLCSLPSSLFLLVFFLPHPHTHAHTHIFCFSFSSLSLAFLP